MDIQLYFDTYHYRKPKVGAAFEETAAVRADQELVMYSLMSTPKVPEVILIPWRRNQPEYLKLVLLHSERVDFPEFIFALNCKHAFITWYISFIFSHHVNIQVSNCLAAVYLIPCLVWVIGKA